MLLPEQESERFIMFGRGGTATDALEAVLALGHDLVGFVDETSDRPIPHLLPHLPVFRDPLQAIEATGTSTLFIAVGDNWARQSIFEKLETSLGGVEFLTLVHPQASVGLGATIGAGSYVGPFARVGNMVRLGRGAAVRPYSVLGHESVFGDFCSFSAGAVTGGMVVGGSRVALGLNASVREKVRIGSGTVVGSHSFVNSDFGSNLVLVGSPAVMLRHRDVDEAYMR